MGGPEVNLKIDGDRSKRGKRAEERAEAELKGQQALIEEYDKQIDDLSSKINLHKISLQGEESKQAAGKAVDLKKLGQLRIKIEDMKDEIISLQTERNSIVKSAPVTVADRIDKKADRMEGRYQRLTDAEGLVTNLTKQLTEAKTADPQDPRAIGSLEVQLAEAQDAAAGMKRLKRKRARAQEMRKVEQASRSAEAGKMKALLGELDSEPPVEEEPALPKDAPAEKSTGELEKDSKDTSEEGSSGAENTDEGLQEAVTLSGKLSEATRGLTEGIVDDLQDPDNIVKQAFVSAKAFLVMFLLGKGGKKASWLTKFDSDQLTLLEKGIGLQVERVNGKAKVNEDGGVSVKWVDPQPEFMPPMRAIKVYKDVFDENWAETPAQKISRTTTMDEMLAFRDAANADNGDQANWNRLIAAMETVNKKEIDGDTLVVDFLEDEYANVRVELGADRETVEAEIAKDQSPPTLEARLTAVGLSMSSTLEESATKLELDEAGIAAALAAYNDANAEKTPLATADTLTMQNLSDSGQIDDLILPEGEVPVEEEPVVVPAAVVPPVVEEPKAIPPVVAPSIRGFNEPPPMA